MGPWALEVWGLSPTQGRTGTGLTPSTSRWRSYLALAPPVLFLVSLFPFLPLAAAPSILLLAQRWRSTACPAPTFLSQQEKPHPPYQQSYKHPGTQ